MDTEQRRRAVVLAHGGDALARRHLALDYKRSGRIDGIDTAWCLTDPIGCLPLADALLAKERPTWRLPAPMGLALHRLVLWATGHLMISPFMHWNGSGSHPTGHYIDIINSRTQKRGRLAGGFDMQLLWENRSTTEDFPPGACSFTTADGCCIPPITMGRLFSQDRYVKVWGKVKVWDQSTRPHEVKVQALFDPPSSEPEPLDAGLPHVARVLANNIAIFYAHYANAKQTRKGQTIRITTEAA